MKPKDLMNAFKMSVVATSHHTVVNGTSGGGGGSPKTATGNSASVSAGIQAIPSDAVKRLAFLLLSTCALLAFRLKIMGSKLPVFTRYGLT